jgi:NitT/TauT family transport system substrate-binding protein
VRALSSALLAVVLLCFALPVNGQERPEIRKVRLAVGGKAALFYLPLTVTERLGYFKSEGLDLQISDFQGGARSLQALIGGSADVVAGAYDHTIQMQAKNQPIVAVVQLGRLPGYVIGVLTSKARTWRGPQDFKGMKIGITAPGSSTQFMVQYLMARHELKPDEASFIGVGTGPSAIAAARRGEIDAIVNVDPVIAVLEGQRLIRVVADTRTVEGTRAVFGGPYPAAVLYTTPAFIERNPRTVQALVNAFVRGLGWMQSHSPEEIARVMPADYVLGDRPLYVRAIRNSLPTYSADGRFSREGAEIAHQVLRTFEPGVGSAAIDLAKTYTDAFLDKVPAGRN